MPATTETSPPAPIGTAEPHDALAGAPTDPLDVALDSALGALQADANDADGASDAHDAHDINAADEVDLLLDDLDKPRKSPRPRTAERVAYRHSRPVWRGGAGRPVLVVDASPIARKFLALRLQGLGYDAHTAGTGERGLELIRQYAFSLVFVELAAGTAAPVDGLALCQDVKQECARTGIPPPRFVVTTGQTGSAHRVRGSLAGVDAFLNKPLVEEEFIDALRAVDPLFI